MARRDLPPLRALTAFEAAARLGSFRLAASELGITRSAVSHQVKSLEQRLGVQLFRRDARRAELTQAGGRFTVGHLRADPFDRGRRMGLMVLLVRRGNTSFQLPTDDFLLQLGDRLLLAGSPRAKRHVELTLGRVQILQRDLRAGVGVDAERHGYSPFFWWWTAPSAGPGRMARRNFCNGHASPLTAQAIVFSGLI